jgi:hypothetical protein
VERVRSFIRTRAAARLTGAAIAIVCCTGMASAARAEQLEFVFSTTLDATDFGLSSLEPFSVRFRYDPLTVPLVITLGNPAVRSIYGPIPAWLVRRRRRKRGAAPSPAASRAAARIGPAIARARRAPSESTSSTSPARFDHSSRRARNGS